MNKPDEPTEHRIRWWFIPAAIGSAFLWPPLVRGIAYAIQTWGAML